MVAIVATLVAIVTTLVAIVAILVAIVTKVVAAIAKLVAAVANEVAIVAKVVAAVANEVALVAKVVAAVPNVVAVVANLVAVVDNLVVIVDTVVGPSGLVGRRVGSLPGARASLWGGAFRSVGFRPFQGGWRRDAPQPLLTWGCSRAVSCPASYVEADFLLNLIRAPPRG